MSKITAAEVRRIADLAHIGLHESEIERMTGELDSIVGFVEQLKTADVEGVPPTDQVTGLVDVWRTDEVSKSYTRDELLKNAPDQQDGFIKVKRVLNND